MGQKIQEKEIVKQKFIAAVHSYFASLQTHNSSLSNRRIVHGVQHLALPLGELAAKPTESALSAPTGHLSHGERQERLCCQYAKFQFIALFSVALAALSLCPREVIAYDLRLPGRLQGLLQ